MASPEAPSIEVAYALAGRQSVVVLEYREGMTAAAAVEASGLLQAFPDMAAGGLSLGIQGRVVEPDQVLRPWDRVDILRPLAADPREARRRAVAANRGKPSRVPRPGTAG